MDVITVRHMDFSFPQDMDPVVVEDRPEESYFFVALSLLLPYLEPYLIRSMKEARPRVSDPALLADLAKFNAQEGQHYQQHARFNAVIREKGFPGLAELEASLEADYRRFSKEKPLAWNLAYAEGFEAFTTATARQAFEDGFEDMHPALRELYLWHLLEELEHRTVAFDVYEHVVGRYLYRLRVGLFAQWHLVSWCGRAARCMLEADPRWPDAYGGEAGRRARTRRQLRRLFTGLLPKALPTYTPWYTPHRIALPAGIEALQEHYDGLALRTSR